MLIASKVQSLVRTLAFITSLGFTLAVCSAQPPVLSRPLDLRAKALPIPESMAAFDLNSEYEIRCIAAEPLVLDPVEAVFDEAGRIWVVEMRDYPFRRDERKPRGRIKVLHPDGLGGYTSSTFVDELDMPTGIALWHGGAVVTLAGTVAYYPDENRDFVADCQKEWITGLSTGNEQLRANHPTLHSDGWWYVASGLRGGTLKAGPDFEAAAGHPPVELSSRDFRFHLGTGKIQAVTGPSQFGLSHDSFGDRFLVSNRNPARKVQFEQTELTGNPLAGLADVVVDVLPAGPESVVIPIVDAWTTSNLHAGQYTAACAVTVATSAALAVDINAPPGAFAESVFVCEPTGSLVTRDTLVRSVLEGRLKWGRISSRKEKNQEWLASRDPWFRPVNLNLTPSGGLLVVDMHRAVIEHPQWVPEELANRPDEQFGNNAGRLYEIRRKRAEENAPSRFQTKSNATDLLQWLASSNTWLRKTAIRTVLERFDTGELSPRTRTELLSILHRYDVELSAAATADLANLYIATATNPTVAAEQMIAPYVAVEMDRPAQVSHLLRLVSNLEQSSPALDDLIQRHLDSPHASVRLSAYQAASKWPENIQAATLQLLDSRDSLKRAIGDRDEMILFAGAMRKCPGKLALALFKVVEQEGSTLSVDPDWTARALAKLVGAVRPLDTPQLQRLQDASERLVSSGDAPQQIVGIHALFALMQNGVDETTISVETVSDLVSLTKLSTTSTGLRSKAIELLSLCTRSTRDLFRELTTDPDWQVAAAAWQALARFEDERFPAALANALATADIRMRPTLIRLIGKTPAACDAIIALLDEKKIDPKNLGSNTLRQLADAHSGDRSEQLRTYLNQITNSDRAKVVAKFRSCLDLSANPMRGKQQFAKHCSSCHVIDGVGQNIGPDISDSRTQSPESLLTAILDPNRAVDNNYFRYRILTLDGGSAEGIIVGEDAERIVLRTADNRRVEIRRAEIEIKKLSGQSLMPEGFENQLSQQQLADLISFIKNWRYLDGPPPATPE